MIDNRFECGCERGGDCTKTTMCQVQDMVDALEAKDQRIEQLEAKLYDSENAYRWLKSELRTNAKIIGEQRDTIEQLEAALRIFDPGMNSLDHLGERDAN